MFVRSTGSSRTVKPGTSICTGGGFFTGDERLADARPRGADDRPVAAEPGGEVAPRPRGARRRRARGRRAAPGGCRRRGSRGRPAGSRRSEPRRGAGRRRGPTSFRSRARPDRPSTASFVPPGPGVEVIVSRRTTPKSDGSAIRLTGPAEAGPLDVERRRTARCSRGPGRRSSRWCSPPGRPGASPRTRGSRPRWRAARRRRTG